MLTLYFPGNGSINKGELESFSAMLAKNNIEHYAQQWIHWSDEAKVFDEDAELDILKEKLSSRNNEVVGIMGKSIGTYFTVKVIKELNLKPKYVVLMGVPTGIGEDKLKVYKDALKGLDSDIYLIQNNKDPYGSMEEVRAVLEGVKYTELLQDADTHIYQYADKVEEIIKKYY